MGGLRDLDDLEPETFVTLGEPEDTRSPETRLAALQTLQVFVALVTLATLRHLKALEPRVAMGSLVAFDSLGSYKTLWTWKPWESRKSSKACEP